MTKAKVVAIYFLFIVYVKEKCVMTIEQKTGGRNWKYTVIKFLYFKYISIFAST